MILETIDERESYAYACICVSICHYKLLALNDQSALVKIITQDKIFVMILDPIL